MVGIRDRENSNKPERIPVDGHRDILTVLNQDPNFVYRWVLDDKEDGSRIMKFIRGGYEFARVDSKNGIGDVVVGEEYVYKSKQGDSIVRHQSSDQTQFLMMIKREWYEQDQKAKQDEIDRLEETITGTGHPDGEDFGQYGRVSIGRG